MAASITTFPQFGDFPTEIRLAIWRLCLPHRVVELDQQPVDIIWDEDEEDDPTCPANSLTQLHNKAPPAVTRVCREARQVAFERGHKLPWFPDPRDPENTQDFAKYMAFDLWLDPERDIIHINWDPMADIDWMSYDWGDPIRCLMSFAARTTARMASFRLGLLRAMKSQDVPHRHYRWTRSELADLIRAQNPPLRWSVVMRPPFLVHADDVAHTDGLFGLLGDAPVQLVEIDDGQRIQKYFDIADTPGSRLNEDALREAQDELLDITKTLFVDLETAPSFHPVLMFRLCPCKTKRISF